MMTLFLLQFGFQVKIPPNDDTITSALKSNSIVACVDESGDAELNKDLIDILKTTKVKYDTVNVASDNAVKEKLISFSGSSSFPQVRKNTMFRYKYVENRPN